MVGKTGAAATGRTAGNRAGRRMEPVRSTPAARPGGTLDGPQQLLAQCSHGLRTTLQQLGGYTDLLLDGAYGELPEAARAPLVSLARSAHDLTQLCTNLLTHTRLATRALQPERRRLAIDELAAQLRSVAATLLVGRPVRFAVETEYAPAALHTDPQAVRAILINLLDNAARWTASGVITLSIVREGSAARLSVADSGPGIAPAELAGIFQPARTGAAAADGGRGLGLALSRQLAEALGGELAALSRPGVGSVFSLLLRGVIPNGDAHGFFRSWPDDAPAEPAASTGASPG